MKKFQFLLITLLTISATSVFADDLSERHAPADNPSASELPPVPPMQPSAQNLPPLPGAEQPVAAAPQPPAPPQLPPSQPNVVPVPQASSAPQPPAPPPGLTYSQPPQPLTAAAPQAPAAPVDPSQPPAATQLPAGTTLPTAPNPAVVAAQAERHKELVGMAHLISKQVKACWKLPKADRKVPSLLAVVDVSEDGHLQLENFATDPTKDQQPLADSIKAAVADPNCNPIKKLPPAKDYATWKTIAITFNSKK